MSVTKEEISRFLENDLIPEEVEDLSGALKCRKGLHDPGLPEEIVKQLYWRFQTPVGYAVRTPTLDDMCDALAKRLKLHKLQDAGWGKLNYLSLCVFEKVLKSMPEERKRDLLKQFWDSLDEEQEQRLMSEFKLADFKALLRASEFTVAHVLGVFMAREMALVAAASLLMAYASSQAALVASRVLTRGVVVALGPIGWGLLALSVNDIMGTNLKSVVPALLILNAARLRAYPAETGRLLRKHG